MDNPHPEHLKGAKDLHRSPVTLALVNLSLLP